MNIVDQCKLIPHIQKLAAENNSREFCAVAVCEYNANQSTAIAILDYSMVDDFGGISEEFSITIPIRLSLAILNVCKKNNWTPLIFHTHPPKTNWNGSVYFSKQDISFFGCFSEYAWKELQLPLCIFAVTNGTRTKYCIWDTQTGSYSIEEE